MRIKTGGPAFPLQYTEVDGTEHVYAGASLRDYFAARAFQSRLAKHNDWTLTELAEQAYSDADALLEARRQEISS